MYELSFFRKKNDPFAIAVTPDKTGLVLPSAERWRYWFSQPVYPERGEGDALSKYRAGFFDALGYVSRHRNRANRVARDPSPHDGKRHLDIEFASVFVLRTGERRAATELRGSVYNRSVEGLPVWSPKTFRND